MALTLGQARPVARVIEGGICPDDARVADTLNEANARLVAKGDFVGTVARWAITVNPTTGEFSIPADAANVMRISECPAGVSHSLQGTMFTDSEYAFVFNSASVVTVQQVTPSTFKVLGSIPAAVDVMGKKKLVPAVEDTDFLIVDDESALKLACLALFREENNAVEMAGALWNSAVTHLVEKTQTAIFEARRVTFTSMLADCPETTVGHARAVIGLALTQGVRMDDHRMIELIGAAEKRIMDKTKSWKSYLFNVAGGILACPREIESLLKIALDNCPATIRAQWFDYDDGGYGYREAPYSGPQVIYRGEAATHSPLPAAGVVSAFTNGSEIQLKVILQGYSGDGTFATETLVLQGNNKTVGTVEFAELTSITKAPSAGSLSVLQGDVEVAFMQPWEMDSKVALYAIPNCSDNDCTKRRVIRVIGRQRWRQKLRDSDKLQIENLQALTMMVESIIMERAATANPDGTNFLSLLNASRMLDSSAVDLVEQEQLNRQVAHATQLNMPRRPGRWRQTR